MNRFILLVVTALILNCVFAQDKNDFQWPMGYPPYDSINGFGGVLLDFHNADLRLSHFDIPIHASAMSAIANKKGDLQFYTNGCKIINGRHELMESGDSLNFGPAYLGYCIVPQFPVWGRYPSYQSLLSLPKPDSDSLYYLFHLRLIDDFKHKEALYTVIDMAQNNGLGSVIEKNKLIFEDTLSPSTTAIRHANGRDWWIMYSKDTTSIYYTLLLDPEGIKGPFVQMPETNWIPNQIATQTTKFSPDGKKMARFGAFAPYFKLYDFDRCDGTLYNPQTIAIPDTISDASWSSFSRSGRYLYVTNYYISVYQYDLWASDISASVVKVGDFDPDLYSTPFKPHFHASTLAPDGKIYLASTNSAQLLHVIESPDSAGLSCNFRQNGLILPSTVSFYTPNFPEFRLYAEEGTVCDSLKIEPPIVSYWRAEQDSLLGPLAVRFFDRSWYKAVSWEWDFGDGNSGNQSNPIHTYGQEGVYNVCLKVCNLSGKCDEVCHDVKVEEKLVGFGQSLKSSNFLIKIYPNPVIDKILLEKEGEGNPEIISIYDAQGKLVFERNWNQAEVKQLLDLESFQSGTYFMRVALSDGLFWLGKFVKI